MTDRFGSSTSIRFSRQRPFTITKFDLQSKNTNAVKAAMNINVAVQDSSLLAASINDQIPKKHVRDIDHSSLFGGKTGVRGPNDGLQDVAKITNGKNMLWAITQTAVTVPVYGSACQWNFD